ncbi:MAG: GGDEF domain-containing protein [Lachnospiraceae bacterium]|nr:GGDEF domain-containing protein [Lachnospiraceae bacterium]
MKKNIHNFKVLKVVELSLFVVLEIIFLVILLANKTISSSIFVDRSLFRLCSIMYITVLVSMGFLIYDFYKLRELKIQSHELENLAYLDAKTGIPNRTSCSLLFENYKTVESMHGIGCVVTKITNIRDINRINGKAFGDRVIRDFSRLFENTAKDYGFVGRNGGNEFITVIEGCDEDRLRTYFDLLQRSLSEYNRGNESSPIEIRSEYSLFDKEPTETFSELVSKVYSKFN